MSYRRDNLQKARQFKESANKSRYRIVGHFHDHRDTLRDQLDSLKTQLAQAQKTILELQVEAIKHNTTQWMCQTLILKIQQQIVLARLKFCFIEQFTFSDITLYLCLLYL